MKKNNQNIRLSTTMIALILLSVISINFVAMTENPTTANSQALYPAQASPALPTAMSTSIITATMTSSVTATMTSSITATTTATVTATITATMTSVPTFTPSSTIPPRPAAALDPPARNGIYDDAPAMAIDVNNTYIATMKTEKGDIKIRLFADQAPITVNNFVFLAHQGYYDNTTFHRVLNNFMAQGGDPTGTGAGGPGYTFEDEFTDELRFDRAGLLAMANSGPSTNGSQFFITFIPTSHLNDAHTIFGEVIEGIEVLDLITRRNPLENPDFDGDGLLFVGIEESDPAQTMTGTPTSTPTSVPTSMVTTSPITMTVQPTQTLAPTLVPTSTLTTATPIVGTPPTTPEPTATPTVMPTPTPVCASVPNLLVTASASTFYTGDIITLTVKTDGGFGIPRVSWSILDDAGEEQTEPIFEALQENNVEVGGSNLDITLEFRALTPGAAVFNVVANGEVPGMPGTNCPFYFTTIAGSTESVHVLDAPSLSHAEFECTDGYYEQINALNETVHIPNDWTLVTSNGTPVINSARTFFAGSCDGSAHVERISGIDSIVVRAQDLETPPIPGKPFDVSFYQQQPAVVGVDYSVSGWMLSLCGGSNVPTDCPEGYYIAKMLGIDPTGGTDPLADTVVWHENRENFVTGDGERIGWANVRTSAKAESPVITVFARLNSEFQWHGNHGFLDAISLVRSPKASLDVLPTCIDGTDLAMSWTTIASEDITAIPSSTHQNLVDIQVREASSNGVSNEWRPIVEDSVGDGNTIFVAEAFDTSYEFRIRARAEQPPAPPEGASPNQRYPGVWSEPVSVFFRDPAILETPSTEVTPQPFPEADHYLFLPMVERQETVRPTCE